ncbi:glycine zipper 2TM domain-containing protein [Polaromonas sp. UBA4122]|uniref:glycine zipper 2TM domain-containing protein n=1 Tax=Polaromonas sp. UBA4122 TaxID=1947074 RepID=UPI0025CCFC25|nr:glycine zipper 2TM domain-containing protein [Polaromonas sp. UBA4122]
MRHASRFISVASSVLLLAGLAACGSTPMYPQTPVSSYPAQYPAQNQQSNYVEYGRVSNVELLQTQGQGQGSGVGAVLGGVAGAVIGHQIGSGGGRDAATVIGAVGGAVAGNAIEKNRNTNVRETYRISVQLDNGAYRSYDVTSPGDLRTGDRVRIENGQLFRY